MVHLSQSCDPIIFFVCVPNSMSIYRFKDIYTRTQIPLTYMNQGDSANLVEFLLAVALDG